MTLDMGIYTENNEECRYQLYSFVNHSGGCSSGHYTATCLDPTNTKKWYCYDDDKTKGINTNEAMTKKAYILFYRK